MKLRFNLKDRDKRIFSVRDNDYNYLVQFFKGWTGVRFMFELAGYFDNRIGVNISLGYGTLYLDLPIRTKYNECDPPRYGLYYHASCFWLCYGRKVKCIHLPFEYTWIRTSCLLKSGNWEHEKRGDRKEFYDEKWNGVIWSESYPYTYVLKSGEIQSRIATLRVEEREWRQRWLKWTKLFSKRRKTINVDFDNEVGERSGSWKGGVTGCGYEMMSGESPEQTLRRMEKEREF